MTDNKQIARNFDELGVSPNLLKILSKQKLTKPTPIQSQCIPAVLQGKDVVGIAQTGTGKTLAFGLPLLQRIAQIKGQALIVTPTRELALQIDAVLIQIGKTFGLKTSIIIGGSSQKKQTNSLARNPHVIIATPGRLIDLMEQKKLSLKSVKFIVLDEADRMLDIGFMPQIKQIFKHAPEKRQTLLFSATMPPPIASIAANYMKIPLRIEVAPSGTTAANIEQKLFIVSMRQKTVLLENILSKNDGSVLIFCRTKHGVRKLTSNLCKKQYAAAEIHSNRSLAQRKTALAGFKNGKYRILVATDVASRGIDVDNISMVINYDLPENSEDYVHRVGRTGRAGSFGKAISFATPEQRGNVIQIERLIKKSIPILSVSSITTDKFTTVTKSFKPKSFRGRRNKRPGRRRGHSQRRRK